jgi:hypothetical protein
VLAWLAQLVRGLVLAQVRVSSWAEADLDQPLVLDPSRVAWGQAQADSGHSAGLARVWVVVGSDRSAGLKPQPKQKPEIVAKIASRY